MGSEHDLRSTVRAPERPARRTVEPEGRKSVARGSAGPIVVSPKLTVGASDDPLEREADRVAADVVATLRRTVDVGSHAGLDDAPAATGSRIRRTARPVEPGPTTAYAAVPRIRRRPDAPGIGGAGGDLDADTESRIRRASGGGRQLDPSTLSTMGRAFGADFSAVRVHANGEAGQLNRQLDARAFTSGNDIFFGAGQYRPSSDDGQRLLAHELTHVVQRQTPAIRRHDAHNSKRLTNERTKNTGPGKQFATKAAAENNQSGMRLDHTVADSKLTALADDLHKVEGFVSKAPAGDLYPAAAAGWEAVDTALDELPVDDEGQGLHGRLANLRMNLVPGLIDASDNVGEEFDPIMETVGGTVQTTVESDAFLEPG